ncbi:MAG: hypothetical protein OFPI_15050 [Osedax symbiont Rs2]|nr:MAG: hypothetical protein OFPI_15050 [Osedax symbiont Rs2]
MSTRLTKNKPPMADSDTLKLVLGAAKVHELSARYLSRGLTQQGYLSVTPSMLNFLSVLDCGVNYASEIARTLGVSRQMVAKTVKELCANGYLQQVQSSGKQKQILFSKSGELLMSDARNILADIDQQLVAKVGRESIIGTVQGLAEISALLVQLNDSDSLV